MKNTPCGHTSTQTLQPEHFSRSSSRVETSSMYRSAISAKLCIMIARILQTQVDLGELDPGTYTVTDALRGADPIQIVVS